MEQIESEVVILTGRIGSGKSTVAKYLLELGATVFSADTFARMAVSPGQPAYSEVVAKFGTSILSPSGEINRKALAKLVFCDETRRRQLESIVHPSVRALASASFDQARQNGASIIVYECPLFFESDLYKTRWRHVVLVTADADLVCRRVCQRDSITAEDVQARLGSQLTDKERVRLLIDVCQTFPNHKYTAPPTASDFKDSVGAGVSNDQLGLQQEICGDYLTVIANDGSLAELEEKVIALYQKLIDLKTPARQ